MVERVDNNQASKVKAMFAQIAEKYDRANRWMTWGQDVRWRREVIDRAGLPLGGRLLDLGTGTGGLALEAMRRDDSILVVGADFAPEMLQMGRSHAEAGSIYWVNNDACYLPYCSGSFDAVVCGYLLRNVGNLIKVLQEQYRVLKAGGRLVCLDTTPPAADVWHFPVRMYLRYMIPMIGSWATGDKSAYTYLSASTSAFMSAADLAGKLRSAGFRQVGFRIFMWGCMAIHWGTK